MLRFIGALLLLFLPLVCCDDDHIEPCPENRVCAVFVEDKCKIHGQMSVQGYIGVVWESDTHCVGGTYDKNMHARIDFELTSGESWSAVVTTYREIYKIKFTFEHADLSFMSDSKAKLTWNYAGKNGETQFPIEKVDPVSRSVYFLRKFSQYKFDISADGERLINLLGGSTIICTASGTFKLSDHRFAQLLAQHSDNDSKVGLILGIIGGLLLLIAIAIAVCFFLRKRKRADQAESKSSKDQKDGPKIKKLLSLFKGKKGASASASEKAKTPGKSSKKKGQSHRPDSNTDIEGLQTERLSKDKTTNVGVVSVDIPAKTPVSPADKKRRTLPPPSPLQEPKGFAATAGPPLPPGFASVALA